MFFNLQLIGFNTTNEVNLTSFKFFHQHFNLNIKLCNDSFSLFILILLQREHLIQYSVNLGSHSILILHFESFNRVSNICLCVDDGKSVLGS
jgi:hypothetical protein